MNVLLPLLLCLGGRPLCQSEDSTVLMNLHWPCDCTAQSSVLSIGSVSLVLLFRLQLSIYRRLLLHTPGVAGISVESAVQTVGYLMTVK